jgi:hypothetical protein
MDVPTLVPTLSRDEVEQLRNIGGNDPLPLSILKKAISYAEQRVTQGKSPFAGIEDVDTASSIPYNEQMRLKQFAQQMQSPEMQNMLLNSAFGLGITPAKAMQVYRGAEDASLKARDFPGTFVTTSKENAAQYGDLQQYLLNQDAKLLDANSKESYSLAKKFVNKHPEIDEWLNTDVYKDPAELYMFPSREWASFLTDKGYSGTKFGKDIFIFDSAYNKLKELLNGN